MDPAVIEYAMVRMLNILPFQVLMVLYEVPAGALRGMGHSLLPAVITVTGSCLLRLVWVYTVFRSVGNFQILVFVYPVSWIITAIAMLSAYFLYARRERTLDPPAAA